MKLRLVLFAAFALVLTACASISPQRPAIEVRDAWVRALPAMGQMNSMSGMAPMPQSSALFLVIQNNTALPDILVKVESEAAGSAQMHLSEVDANGVSSMHEVDGIVVPPGGMVELRPGGYHIMLMDLKRELKAGDTVTFTLTFKNAGTVVVEAPIKAP